MNVKQCNNIKTTEDYGLAAAEPVDSGARTDSSDARDTFWTKHWGDKVLYRAE